MWYFNSVQKFMEMKHKLPSLPVAEATMQGLKLRKLQDRNFQIETKIQSQKNLVRHKY